MAVAALLFGAALPATAAAPFGQFGGKAGGGNSGAGMLPLVGWALDDNGVASVDILVDGIYAGRASYGRGRPGVARQYPGYPDSNAAGWAFQLDTTHYLNGKHTITARVTSNSGEVVDLPSKKFNFLNAASMLRPFGHILFPINDAEQRGRCTLTDPTRRYSVIEGVVFDVGTEEQNKKGVAWVELMLDGGLLFNTKRDCFFSTTTGGYTQCFGLRSDGWTAIYPTIKDSDRAMVRFVLDVGMLIAPLSQGGFGYAPGSHMLTLRAGDKYDNVSNVASVLVYMSCDEHEGNEPSEGFLDQPAGGNIYGGTIPITGWAVDWEGVSSVAIRVNGVVQGNATLGFPNSAITSRYPGYPQAGAPGFRYFLDTTKHPDGFIYIELLVTDVFGDVTLAGERRIAINNVDG